MGELVGETEAEFILMNVDEQRESLLEQRTNVLEMEISRYVYDREQQNLQTRLEGVGARLIKLDAN